MFEYGKMYKLLQGVKKEMTLKEKITFEDDYLIKEEIDISINCIVDNRFNTAILKLYECIFWCEKKHIFKIYFYLFLAVIGSAINKISFNLLLREKSIL